MNPNNDFYILHSSYWEKEIKPITHTVLTITLQELKKHNGSMAAVNSTTLNENSNQSLTHSMPVCLAVAEAQF